MINLKKTYLYAGILFVSGALIYAIWFLDLLPWFLIAASVTLINYYFLARMEQYKSFTYGKVFGTLFLRYIVYIIVAFTVIWLQKDSPHLIEIGISLILGFSVIQVASIINALTARNEVK